MFGPVQRGDELWPTMESGTDWAGKVVFDAPRHKTNIRLPLDWPRINQFPEWLTVQSDKKHLLSDAGFVAAAAMVLSPFASAQWTLDKVPDVGAWWNPLGASPATAIYANSFVYTGTTGDVLTTLGVHIQQNDAQQGQDLRFFLLGDGANNPTNTFLSTSTVDVSTNSSSLVLLTASMSPYAMTNGTRYWFAAQGQGNNGLTYQVGGHTQNSVYNDNGTFWYSNPNDFSNWDGQGLTPEMAVYAETVVPEPASMMILGLGLAALAARRRRRK